MKLGITLGNFSFPVPVAEFASTVGDLARQADESGFDSLWVMDHFFQIRITGEPVDAPMPEAYTTLGFLAGRTSRIRLGTMVTSVAYRHPGVLLKSATALDVWSGGRTYFGIGAGAPFDPEPQGTATVFEAEGLGIPFPPLARRFEQLEEVLQIAHRMWAEDETPYTGRHYQLPRPLNSPNSVQRPHPPILVAGSGEKKTLRLVARYADACNLFDLPGTGYADNLTHKLDVLRKHCAEVGRDYDSIEKTVASHVDPGAERGEFLAHLRDLARLGLDHVLLAPPGPWTRQRLAALAELLPEIHAL
ncbi:LLM class F420-dependent oxidoreductase [Nocardia sp. alder85J]|uniref:LLM class F420-dependent oxidoreductase n=1 Tax=Nocardia sp. alder85J TaxID=2862949 RepID=UPI001CD7914A|nr:LLM class F420-dependent oxidoreductase [Nocardia sp. alder85J]MCX4095357.1 LLM class F420-dependent oxidoreductase [Nocardia sp. alder85J]